MPDGLYLFGCVGRGKTMLMDLFFETVPLEAKACVHFHEFMSDVHGAIAAARTTHEGDPISHVADAVATGARLLCFDELHVTDIADVMILSLLFTRMFEANVVVVATSNAGPSELYRQGLNRPLFEPFIVVIADRVEVLELEAEKYYRLDKLQGAKLYFPSNGTRSEKRCARCGGGLPGAKEARRLKFHSKGAQFRCPSPRWAPPGSPFADLWEAPLGAGDNFHIAHANHTVFLSGIPVMRPNKRNETRRFITLIDTLYDNGVRLIVATRAEPDRLSRKTTAPICLTTPLRGSSRCARRPISRGAYETPMGLIAALSNPLQTP